MSKDIEETWVNIPANPAAKSAQSNKADTNDISETTDGSYKGPTLCNCDDTWHIAGVPDGEGSYYSIGITDELQNLIAQETNKARLDELNNLPALQSNTERLVTHVWDRIKVLTADKEPKP